MGMVMVIGLRLLLLFDPALVHFTHTTVSYLRTNSAVVLCSIFVYS